MALFTRNVTGDDIIALWRHIKRNGPVDRGMILRRYYPGNAEDPDQSDSRKPLQDAIDFLEEAGQIERGDDGYSIADPYNSASSARTALLHGLRMQDGEDAAYMDVLDVLTEQDRRHFDQSNKLVDLMSSHRSETPWNAHRLSYWTRAMSALGIVAGVNSDSGEEHTHVLSLSQDLLQELFRTTMELNEPYELASVLTDIDEEYLPVFATANRDTVATYVQRALQEANVTDFIELRQDSDFGTIVDINDSGYNSIILRAGGAC